MKKIDDILNSLQQQRPVISDPDELTNRIIDSLPDLDCPKAKPAKRVRIYIATVVAVAACIMLLVMLTTNMDTRENEKPIAQNDLVRREPDGSGLQVRRQRTPSPTGADWMWTVKQLQPPLVGSCQQKRQYIRLIEQT